MDPAARPCRVLLIGMMGSGKTTVGEQLATRAGWPYVDNDAVVQRLTGVTSRELLATHGEAALRAGESRALAVALRTPPPAVIGVPAGTVLARRDRERLRLAGLVVYLRAAPEILEARAAGAAHRPFVDAGEEGWVRAAATARDPLYAAIADLILDGGASDPEEMVVALVEQLRVLGPCHDLMRG